jgi:hypothetical protein
MSVAPQARPYLHAVQFYGSESRLFSTVGAFISEGLISGDPAMIIATPSHASGIQDQLRTRLIDVGQARRIGDLVVLDANDALDLFMVGDTPDPRAFEMNIGRYVGQSLRGRSGNLLRAYGEMVDILWKQGRSEAAVRLEALWNTMAARLGVALLCGYSMGNFYKQTERFEEVCRQHTHVLDPDSKVPAFRPTA